MSAGKVFGKLISGFLKPEPKSEGDRYPLLYLVFLALSFAEHATNIMRADRVTRKNGRCEMFNILMAEGKIKLKMVNIESIKSETL
jgi:hypothetical protein